MIKIIMHKVISFTESLCGTPCNLVNHGGSTRIENVNCIDCLTIIEIQTRNKSNYFNVGSV